VLVCLRVVVVVVHKKSKFTLLENEEVVYLKLCKSHGECLQ
jgi:hypothetical protein